MSIRIFDTGGTAAKMYDPIAEKLIFDQSNIDEILTTGRNSHPVEIETLMLVDSLLMSQDQRQYIADRCRECLEDKILVSHGTGRAIETAATIAKELGYDKTGQEPGMTVCKTVCVFGSMLPYSIRKSDRVFNLAFALAAVQVLKPGVYVPMNGKIFPWYDVQKNDKTGIFGPIH